MSGNGDLDATPEVEWPSPADILAYKRMAAEAASLEVQSGMLVGLGSGTTAALAIEALGRRVREGLEITVFASSVTSGLLAERAGLHPEPFDERAKLDLTIDGVDEIDPALRAIKGGGAALLREKILADAADRMIAIADFRKCAVQLGGVPLPVEVLPFARGFVAERIRCSGGEANWRRHGDSPVCTDQGNHILDCHFPALEELVHLAGALSAIPGLMAHGLFLTEIDALYVAGPEGLRLVERSGAPPKPASGQAGTRNKVPPAAVRQ